MSKPVNVEDYRALARDRLPRMVFDYLEGGAEDETGLAHNREAFQRVRLRSCRYSLRTLIDGVTHPRWSMSYMLNGMPQLANFVSADASDTELQAALMSRQMDATFSFEDLKWLREIWPRKLLVKGLSRWEDAERCIAMGVDGVIFSNHGGRQLDGAVAPFDVLCGEENTTGHPVIIDSGVRRGSDVVKAVAAGATAVLLGRATLYGLAAAGESGVDDVLAIFK
jgi:(S)-mandelate dehydrogenase